MTIPYISNPIPSMKTFMDWLNRNNYNCNLHYTEYGGHRIYRPFSDKSSIFENDNEIGELFLRGDKLWVEQKEWLCDQLFHYYVDEDEKSLKLKKDTIDNFKEEIVYKIGDTEIKYSKDYHLYSIESYKNYKEWLNKNNIKENNNLTLYKDGKFIGELYHLNSCGTVLIKHDLNITKVHYPESFLKFDQDIRNLYINLYSIRKLEKVIK